MELGNIVVAVADDDELIRAALAELIEATDGFELAGTAEDADSAVALCERSPPDAIVLDVHMPGGGPTAAARIRATSPDTVIIAFSADPDPRNRERMVSAGASAYLVKGAPRVHLLESIRTALGCSDDPSAAGP